VDVMNTTILILLVATLWLIERRVVRCMRRLPWTRTPPERPVMEDRDG
jgi:hypothetical protein